MGHKKMHYSLHNNFSHKTKMRCVCWCNILQIWHKNTWINFCRSTNYFIIYIGSTGSLMLLARCSFIKAAGTPAAVTPATDAEATADAAAAAEAAAAAKAAAAAAAAAEAAKLSSTLR